MWEIPSRSFSWDLWWRGPAYDRLCTTVWKTWSIKDILVVNAPAATTDRNPGNLDSRWGKQRGMEAARPESCRHTVALPEWWSMEWSLLRNPRNNFREGDTFHRQEKQPVSLSTTTPLGSNFCPSCLTQLCIYIHWGSEADAMWNIRGKSYVSSFCPTELIASDWTRTHTRL